MQFITKRFLGGKRMAKVCIIGFGCIGSGTYEVLKQNKDIIAKRAGETIEVKYIVDIKDLSYHEAASIVTTDFNKVLSDNEVDVVIETMGGTTYAYDYTLSALKSGKSVITSNKELVAAKGDELSAIAKEKGVKYLYEAAVGGGIPIIRTISESLGANNITEITGILNGTTNYILSRMTSEGSDYEVILKESQELGIAETDPTQDVEGIDAACKTVILANSLLGIDATYSDVKAEGISNINSQAIELAKKDDYLTKLIAEVSPENLQVSPRLVKRGSSYDVSGTLNMATIKTDLADEVSVIGLGAGSLETASAMLTDLISILRNKS
jgi:homoserine dehydrogenase